MSDGQITLHPRWKQAVDDFLSAGFFPGDLIPHSWLAEHFGMPLLDDAATLTPAQYRDRQFEWLQNIESVKSELLEQHQILLASVYGEGYRWVPSAEQTNLAVGHFEREALQAYKKAGRRLVHVRVDELTDEQRRENMDAIGRLSLLQGMHKALA